MRRDRPTDYIVRFSSVQRIEHFSMILLFAVLLLAALVAAYHLGRHEAKE